MCSTKGALDPFDIHGSSAPWHWTHEGLYCLFDFNFAVIFRTKLKIEINQDRSTLAFPISPQNTFLFKYK